MGEISQPSAEIPSQHGTAGKLPLREAGRKIEPPESPASQPSSIGTLPLFWLAGWTVVIVVLLTSVGIWGPGMEFPTTVSRTEVKTENGGTLILETTVREVIGDVIDDGVDWLTTEASWLFDGLSTAVSYALVYIENRLKWVPWPAIVVALALLSFAVGRWGLLSFTLVALLFVGFMGLWENTIETIALMMVAVVISVTIGLPLGVLGARNQTADNLMRPILDGMQTMPSFVYLLPGLLFFGLGKPAGIFATIIYAVPPVIRLTNLGDPPGVGRSDRGRPSIRNHAIPAAHQSANPDGIAHNHGRHQPNHDDGLGDDNHRQHGGRRRSGRKRAACAAKKSTGQWGNCRSGDRIFGHRHRPPHAVGGPRSAGDPQRWLASAWEAGLLHNVYMLHLLPEKARRCRVHPKIGGASDRERRVAVSPLNRNSESISIKYYI